MNSETEQSLRNQLALLFGGAPEQIALLSNASEVISSIALAMELQPGDNVVVHELEFPSGILPWLALQQAGVEVRVVPHADWDISIDDIMSRVDRRTRLVLTSHVSYLSGACIDYASLYERLTQWDALLIVDVTQSLGVIPVDLAHADIMVSSSYKWLLATHGLGIMALNPARTAHLRPKSIGWRGVSDMFSDTRFERFTWWDDARRFELGYPAYAVIYAMDASLRLLLDIGVDRIAEHVRTLGTYAMERLQSLGYGIMTPQEPARRAGNICITAKNGAMIADHLYKQGIYLWGGDGRFRASVHLFNDQRDIDKLVDSLKQWSNEE